MQITTLEMPQLFEQLGLESSDSAIEQFIKNHPLAKDILLQDAEFWTESQGQFIKDSLRQDSDWAPVVDQLNTRLRH